MGFKGCLCEEKRETSTFAFNKPLSFLSDQLVKFLTSCGLFELGVYTYLGGRGGGGKGKDLK
jgi:hypothetical protein